MAEQPRSPALLGVLGPAAPVGPFRGPRYGVDGICFGCGEPVPATRNTWTPIGLFCTGCRVNEHGLSFHESPMGPFWMWTCGGCNQNGPHVSVKKMTWKYVDRSFKLHLARCVRPRVVLRAGGVAR